MNKFIKNIVIKSVCLLSLISIFILGTIYLNYNHKVDYPAAIKGKYERLDSLKGAKKIIIAGGSSSSYSINSKLFQSALSIPVINTSLAMSLGSYFHLNITKDYLLKGDVVLYIPEYEFYYGNELGDDFLYTTAFYYPQIIKDFNREQKVNGLNKIVRLPVDFFMGLLKNKIIKKEKISLQYNRTSYNYLGDNISLDSIENTKIKKSKINRYQKLKSKELSNKFLNFLKTFNEYCNQKGVKLIISFPPIEESQYDNRFIKDIFYLKNETGIKFIGTPLDFIYKADLFYDSSYHLNGKGREKRSLKLLEILKKELN